MKFKVILCVVITSGMLYGSQPPADVQQSSSTRWSSWIPESIRNMAAKLMATSSNRPSFSAPEKQVTAQDYIDLYVPGEKPSSEAQVTAQDLHTSEEKLSSDTEEDLRIPEEKLRGETQVVAVDHDEAKNACLSIREQIDLYRSGEKLRSSVVGEVAKEIRKIVDDLKYPTPSTKIQVLLKKNIGVPCGIEDTDNIISEACTQLLEKVMKDAKTARPDTLAKNEAIDASIERYKEKYGSSTDIYGDILTTLTPEAQALAFIASVNDPNEVEYISRGYLVSVIKDALKGVLKDAFDYTIVFPTLSTRLDTLLKRNGGGIDIFTEACRELIQEEEATQSVEEQVKNQQIDVEIRELNSRLAQSQNKYKAALDRLSVDERARIAVALQAECVECQKEINPEIFEKTNFSR